MQSTNKPYKEITLQFIYNNDNTISLWIKPSDVNYNTYEIYIAYRYLYQLLHNLNFDWSIESKINTIVKERDDNNG